MTDWQKTKNGILRHPWCGEIVPVNRGRDDEPTRYCWTDRRGRQRGTFASPVEAKRYARKLSGPQTESDA